MLSQHAFHRLYRISAWYDLLLSWPFATAWTFALLWAGLLSSFIDFLGLDPLAQVGVHGVLFANFFGSVVVVWSVFRLVKNDPQLARWDGIARGLFSVSMVQALISGAHPILIVFLIPEVLFCVLQWLPVKDDQRPSFVQG